MPPRDRRGPTDEVHGNGQTRSLVRAPRCCPAPRRRAGTRSPGRGVTCVTIRADETVASVAQRITGDARNMQAPWFQIVNPTTSRRVPKTRYGFIFAGWNACIVDRPLPDVAHAGNRARRAHRCRASVPSPPFPRVVPSRESVPASVVWGPPSSGARSCCRSRSPAGWSTSTSQNEPDAAHDEAVRRPVRRGVRAAADSAAPSATVPSSRGCVSSRLVRDSTSCSRPMADCVIRT